MRIAVPELAAVAGTSCTPRFFEQKRCREAARHLTRFIGKDGKVLAETPAALATALLLAMTGSATEAKLNWYRGNLGPFVQPAA